MDFAKVTLSKEEWSRAHHATRRWSDPIVANSIYSLTLPAARFTSAVWLSPYQLACISEAIDDGENDNHLARVISRARRELER